jgi:hypothetical protein
VKEEHHMIATTILAKVDTERVQGGVEGLASGAYSITLTRFTGEEKCPRL